MDTQVAAEQRLKFGQVLGVNNPADMFIKHFDGKTKGQHTCNLGCKAVDGLPMGAPNLHNISTSIDAYQRGSSDEEWPWLVFMKGSKHNTIEPRVSRECFGNLNKLKHGKHTTDVRQQVLWGFNGRLSFSGIQLASSFGPLLGVW